MHQMFLLNKTEKICVRQCIYFVAQNDVVFYEFYI